MKISLCKHRFPVQPPDGSILRPGNCSRCGLSWADVQADLDRQENLLRLSTAHRAACAGCSLTRMVFRYQREQQPWDETEPPVIWLCVRDWSYAREREETTGFFDFDDVFQHGTDEQLYAALRGAL